MVSRQTVSNVSSIVLLIGASVALFLAESAFWINHTIFDHTTFSNIATAELQKEDSRAAIAAEIVDSALADKPLVRQVAGGKAESLISGLLASNAGDQVIRSVIDRTYAYITSSDRADVAIELSTLHTSLGTLLNVAQKLGGGENIEAIDETIPATIVLVRSETFPDISGAVRTMLWIEPLLWLLSIGLFVGYVYLNRSRFAKSTYVVAAVIVAVAFSGLVLTPFIPSSVAVTLPDIGLRPIAENLTNGFLLPFREQMIMLFLVTAIATVVFSQRAIIGRIVRSLAGRVAK